MENQLIWLLIAVVAVVALGAAMYAVQRRRSHQLRAHFGPEYEHALDGHGERRAAERALVDRTRRVNKLEIRPLPVLQREELWNRWQRVQSQFVDDPDAAIREAHSLLAIVMREQGYPTGRFEEEVELLSVHHPTTVQHYREAHRLAEERATGQSVTEHLRLAMIHYRALFEDMLQAGVARDPARPDARRDIRGERGMR